MQNRINFFNFKKTNVHISAGPYHADSTRSLSYFLDELSKHKIDQVFAIGRTYSYHPQGYNDPIIDTRKLVLADFNNYFIPNENGQVVLPDLLSDDYKITSKPIKKVGRITTYEISINNKAPIRVHHYPLRDVQPLNLTPDELNYVAEIRFTTSTQKKLLTHCAGGRGRSAQVAYIFASTYEKYKSLDSQAQLASMRTERTGKPDSDEFVQTRLQEQYITNLVIPEFPSYEQADAMFLNIYRLVTALFQAEITRLDQKIKLTDALHAGTRIITKFTEEQQKLIQLLNIYHTLSEKKDIAQLLGAIEEAESLKILKGIQPALVGNTFRSGARSIKRIVRGDEQKMIADAKNASAQRELTEEMRYRLYYNEEMRYKRDNQATITPEQREKKKEEEKEREKAKQDPSVLPEKPKVWIFDMDDTLVDLAAGRIKNKEKLFKALRYAKDNGIEIFLCTNRTDAIDQDPLSNGDYTISRLLSEIKKETGIEIPPECVLSVKESVQKALNDIGHLSEKVKRENNANNNKNPNEDLLTDKSISRLTAGKNYLLDEIKLRYNAARRSLVKLQTIQDIKNADAKSGYRVVKTLVVKTLGELKESDCVFIDDSKNIINQTKELTEYRTVKAPFPNEDSQAYLTDLAYESGEFNSLITFLNSDSSTPPNTSNILYFNEDGFKDTPIVRHVPLSQFYNRVHYLTKNQSKMGEHNRNFTLQAVKLYPTVAPSLKDDIKTNALKFLKENIEDIRLKLLKIKPFDSANEASALLGKLKQLIQIQSLYEKNIDHCDQVKDNLIKLKEIVETNPDITNLIDDSLTISLYTSRLTLSILDKEIEEKNSNKKDLIKLKKAKIREDLTNCKTINQSVEIIKNAKIFSDVLQKTIENESDLFLHDILHHIKMDILENKHPINNHKLAFENISKYVDFNRLLTLINQNKDAWIGNSDAKNPSNKQEIIEIYIAQAYIRQYDHLDQEKKDDVDTHVIGYLKRKIESLKEKLINLDKVTLKEVERESRLFQVLKESIALCKLNKELAEKINPSMEEDILHLKNTIESKSKPSKPELNSNVVSLSDIELTGTTEYFVELRGMLKNKELFDKAILDRGSIELNQNNEKNIVGRKMALNESEHLFDFQGKVVDNKDYHVDQGRTSKDSLQDFCNVTVSPNASTRECLIIEALIFQTEANLFEKKFMQQQKRNNGQSLKQKDIESINNETNQSRYIKNIQNVRLDSPLGYDLHPEIIKLSETRVLQSLINHLDEYKKRGGSKHQNEIHAIQKKADSIINEAISFDEKTIKIAELLEKELIKQKNSFMKYTEMPIINKLVESNFSKRIQHRQDDYQYPRLLATAMRDLYAINPELEKSAEPSLVQTIRDTLIPANQLLKETFAFNENNLLVTRKDLINHAYQKISTNYDYALLTHDFYKSEIENKARIQHVSRDAPNPFQGERDYPVYDHSYHYIGDHEATTPGKWNHFLAELDTSEKTYKDFLTYIEEMIYSIQWKTGFMGGEEVEIPGENITKKVPSHVKKIIVAIKEAEKNPSSVNNPWQMSYNKIIEIAKEAGNKKSLSLFGLGERDMLTQKFYDALKDMKQTPVNTVKAEKQPTKKNN